jgi:hypothetical protein
LISIYMLLGNIPKLCWRLLQRLKIVVAKDTVEKWVKQFTKTVKSTDSILWFVFDNCNFYLHKTKVTSTNKGSYLNTITQFIVEIPKRSSVFAINLWQNIDRVSFGTWIQSNNDNSLEFVSKCWETFINRPGVRPLKFLFENTESNVQKCDFTMLEAIVDRETLKYEDVEAVVEQFWIKYIEPTPRVFAFLGGDQQVWIKLWMLRLKNPNKYHWMIPIPGEWHWTWHILKGIFAMYHESILLPFAHMLGFKKVDKTANNFHYAEDLLEKVTNAIEKWIKKSMENTPGNPSLTDWLHSIKPNRNAYELAYACINYFVPYWITRSALKWNKVDEMKDL